MPAGCCWRLLSISLYGTRTRHVPPRRTHVLCDGEIGVGALRDAAAQAAALVSVPAEPVKVNDATSRGNGPDKLHLLLRDRTDRSGAGPALGGALAQRRGDTDELIALAVVESGLGSRRGGLVERAGSGDGGGEEM